MDAWPIILAMLSIGMPALSDNVPNVWRAIWNDRRCLIPHANPTVLSLLFIVLRLQPRGKTRTSPSSFTACSSWHLLRIPSAIGCSGTTDSTFVFCRSLRISLLPSADVWICENFRRYISAMASPVKQEKRNIFRACSASLSFTFSAMSLATSLFCKKRIFLSSFS